MTQATPIYSMRGRGGLPSDAGGIRGSLSLGAGLPGISVPAPLAGRIPLPALPCRQGLAPGFGFVAVCRLRPPSFGHGGNDLPGYPHSAQGSVPGHVVGDDSEERRQPSGVAARIGLGNYQTAWAWLHKLRRAMVRPGRDRLAGVVEVDETYLGGLEEVSRVERRRRGS